MGSMVCGAPRPAKGAGLTPTQAKLDDRPVETGRPRKPLDDAQMAARRASWRASKRRARDQAEARAALRADVAAIRLERAS